MKCSMQWINDVPSEQHTMFTEETVQTENERQSQARKAFQELSRMSLESERPDRAGHLNWELWSGSIFTLMSQGHCREQWVATTFFEVEVHRG